MNREQVIDDFYEASVILRHEQGRAFELVRHEDVSGVSGTGVIADGIQFHSGLVILHWYPPYESTVRWESLDLLLGAHGHGGKTVVHWLDEAVG